MPITYFSSYTVDMSIGFCSCENGKDGSPCKHQYLLWSANIAHCINFVPVDQPHMRKKLAWVAIGNSLHISYYKNLRDRDDQDDNENSTVSSLIENSNKQCECTKEVCEDSLPVVEDPSDSDNSELCESAVQSLRLAFEKVTEKLESTKDANLARGILAFSKRAKRLALANNMHANLTTAFFNFGSSDLRKTGKGKKIKVQPNRKRKSGNGSRQAVSKGRPTQMKTLPLPSKRPRRSHSLAEAIVSNTQSSKKSGSHVMKSKSKYRQKRTHTKVNIKSSS